MEKLAGSLAQLVVNVRLIGVWEQKLGPLGLPWRGFLDSNRSEDGQDLNMRIGCWGVRV